MKKVVKFGLPGFIALLILLWFGLRSYLSFSIADYYGDITIAGIEQPVEVTFDEKGIPQVWAETDRDMYFTLGWLHASERLFQMELVRRVVYGELAELFGDSLYAIDLKQRRIGFAAGRSAICRILTLKTAPSWRLTAPASMPGSVINRCCPRNSCCWTSGPGNGRWSIVWALRYIKPGMLIP